MPLSDDQKQALREEEYFRAAVRREIAATSPPTVTTRLSAFFDTKTGFWLLTTVLAGLVATGMTWLQRYVDREEIRKRATAERALRDTDTLLKLGPMLTSEKRSQVDMAIVLLDGLSTDAAVDARVSSQIKALIGATLDAGLKPGASAEQRAQAEAILLYGDKPAGEPSAGTSVKDGNAPGSSGAVVAAIDNVSLPTRVYIQVVDQVDRALAERASQSLRDAGLIVPGIEVVGAGRSPQRDTVRYCKDKVTPEALARVTTAIDRLEDKPSLVVLDPKLCGRVRANHFELWLARHG